MCSLTQCLGDARRLIRVFAPDSQRPGTVVELGSGCGRVCFSRMYINSLPTAPQALCEGCEVADRARLDGDTAWETEGSEFPSADNRVKLETGSECLFHATHHPILRSCSHLILKNCMI